MSGIYLDHAATTPMLEVAITAMDTQLRTLGNPSSLHTQGRAVRKDLEEARESIARAVDCDPTEVIFTASGTEANNTALKGIYWSSRKNGRNVVVISAIEHHAILDPALWLAEHEGAEIVYIGVDVHGVIKLDELREFIEQRADEIAVISVMASNNETGVIQPIAEVVAIAGDIPVHSDAVQSFRKSELSFNKLGLYAMTISAHKIGGPIGVGALILKRTIEIPALLHGGGQEREIRSGTLNAPAIVSFAAAVSDHSYQASMVSELRDFFAQEVVALIPDAYVNGINAARLPGIVNVTFPGTQSDTLLLLMDAEKVSCSTGSACSAGVHRPSHVLLAMGHNEITAQSSLRFSFGSQSTIQDCQYALSVLPDVIRRGRAANFV
ncbi:MAG: aminotransferase class V-fold PLP-dependent enzyme [Actinobacteria bacterium]|nr:aminotransferase class V-fold PLP-dependent enzyme [Actinomycetota bacterium]